MKIAVSYFDKLDWWPNKNFKGICDSLFNIPCNATVTRYTPEELLHIKDYDAVFLMRGGDAMSDEHIHHYKKNNILVSIWHDDIFSWKLFPHYYGDIYHWKLKKFACHSKELMKWFEVADILFFPYINTFLKFRKYQKFKTKVVWLPWSAPDSLLESDATWRTRKDKIVLSGHMYKQYTLRNIIEKYSVTNSGKEILTCLKHYGYCQKSQSKMTTGHSYWDFLKAHKGAVATSAIKASDFHRAKYMEIPACGCLPFLEYTPDIHFLGFVDGINCIVIDKFNYKEKFQMIYSEKASVIARNARELVEQKHLHSHRAATIVSCIVNKLRLR